VLRTLIASCRGLGPNEASVVLILRHETFKLLSDTVFQFFYHGYDVSSKVYISSPIYPFTLLSTVPEASPPAPLSTTSNYTLLGPHSPYNLSHFIHLTFTERGDLEHHTIHVTFYDEPSCIDVVRRPTSVAVRAPFVSGMLRQLRIRAQIQRTFIIVGKKLTHCWRPVHWVVVS